MGSGNFLVWFSHLVPCVTLICLSFPAFIDEADTFFANALGETLDVAADRKDLYTCVRETFNTRVSLHSPGWNSDVYLPLPNVQVSYSVLPFDFPLHSRAMDFCFLWKCHNLPINSSNEVAMFNFVMSKLLKWLAVNCCLIYVSSFNIVNMSLLWAVFIMSCLSDIEF